MSDLFDNDSRPGTRRMKVLRVLLPTVIIIGSFLAVIEVYNYLGDSKGVNAISSVLSSEDKKYAGLSEQEKAFIKKSHDDIYSIHPLKPGGMLDVYFERTDTGSAIKTVNATQIKLDTGLDIANNRDDYERYVKQLDDAEQAKANLIHDQIIDFAMKTLGMSKDDAQRYVDTPSDGTQMFQYIQQGTLKHCIVFEPAVTLPDGVIHYQRFASCYEDKWEPFHRG